MECRQSLPTEFVDRLRHIFRREWIDIVLHSLETTKRTSLRINRLLANSDEVSQHLDSHKIDFRRVEWFRDALTVDAADRPTLVRSPLIEQGKIYIQGLSSMLVSLLLDPKPGEEVLDMAAAPGGKATHIAQLMDNHGRLAVIEPIRKRMYILADNLKRLGVTIAKTYLMDGRKVGRKTPGRFDRILLDAPCSGEARFNVHEPSSFQYWSERKIAEQSRKQIGLIQSGFEALKPGGILIYCTCSFAPEENERIVSRLLNSNPSAHISELEMPISNWQPGLVGFQEEAWQPELENCRRIVPNEMMDGLFIAKIVKQ